MLNNTAFKHIDNDETLDRTLEREPRNREQIGRSAPEPWRPPEDDVQGCRNTPSTTTAPRTLSSCRVGQRDGDLQLGVQDGEIWRVCAVVQSHAGQPVDVVWWPACGRRLLLCAGRPGDADNDMGPGQPSTSSAHGPLQAGASPRCGHGMPTRGFTTNCQPTR